jgi:hypothetical protein
MKTSRWLPGSLAAVLAFSGAARAEDAPAEPPAAEPAPAEPAPAAEPAAAPRSDTSVKRWTLGFTHGPLRRVSVDDGSGRMSTFIYMVMTAENKTGLARAFRPNVLAKVDTKTEPYVAIGFPQALAAIRVKEQDSSLKLLEELANRPGAEGRIPAGAKWTFVAIFGPVDPGWASFRVEVHGLLNAVTTIKVRKYGDKQIVLEAAYAARNEKVMAELRAAAKASGSEIPPPTVEYQEIRERRAYVIEYQRQGDEFRSDDDPIDFVREGWEVIGDPKVLRVIPAQG